MATKDEPCKQCGLIDRYVKGKFSYCRPCHNESTKRWTERKAQGISAGHKPPPARTMEQLLKRKPAPLRCPQGHLMSGDNVRITSQRNGRRLDRRCRACERNRKRVAYGLAPEPTPTSLADLLDD